MKFSLFFASLLVITSNAHALFDNGIATLFNCNTRATLQVDGEAAWKMRHFLKASATMTGDGRSDKVGVSYTCSQDQYMSLCFIDLPSLAEGEIGIFKEENICVGSAGNQSEMKFDRKKKTLEITDGDFSNAVAKILFDKLEAPQPESTDLPRVRTGKKYSCREEQTAAGKLTYSCTLPIADETTGQLGSKSL
jgi:hypothetical protein